MGSGASSLGSRGGGGTGCMSCSCVQADDPFLSRRSLMQDPREKKLLQVQKVPSSSGGIMGSAVERGRRSQGQGAPAPSRMLVEVTPIKRPRPASAPLGSPLLRLERERGAATGVGAAGASHQRNQPQHRVKSSKPEVRTSGLIRGAAATAEAPLQEQFRWHSSRKAQRGLLMLPSLQLQCSFDEQVAPLRRYGSEGALYRRGKRREESVLPEGVEGHRMRWAQVPQEVPMEKEAVMEWQQVEQAGQEEEKENVEQQQQPARKKAVCFADNMVVQLYQCSSPAQSTNKEQVHVGAGTKLRLALEPQRDHWTIKCSEGRLLSMVRQRQAQRRVRQGRAALAEIVVGSHGGTHPHTHNRSAVAAAAAAAVGEVLQLPQVCGPVGDQLWERMEKEEGKEGGCTNSPRHWQASRKSRDFPRRKDGRLRRGSGMLVPLGKRRAGKNSAAGGPSSATKGNRKLTAPPLLVRATSSAPRHAAPVAMPR